MNKKLKIIGLIMLLLSIFVSGCSSANTEINCEYKSYGQISPQISVGMSKSQIVSKFGNADSVYVQNLGVGMPCRTVDVLRYACKGETTAIGFCDGEYIGSIKKE